jgi:hypothetical protein
MEPVADRIDMEPGEHEHAEHAPSSPVILLLFTFFTGLGLVIAGTWILHGNAALVVIGAIGLVVGAGGLYMRYAQRKR